MTWSESGELSPEAIPREVLENWPTPPEARKRVWDNYNLAQKERWLLNHAFTVSDGRMVIRPETRDTETSQQVVQVVNTIHGGWNLVEAIAAQHIETLPWNSYENRHALPTATDNYFAAILKLVAVLVVIALAAFLLVALFGGDGDSESAADDPAGEVLEGAGQAEADAGAAAADPGIGDPAEQPGTESLTEEELETELIASAVGVYRVSAASFRRAFESTDYDFESAEGAIVIETDGTVSGDYTYTFWGPYGGSQARVAADVTLDPGSNPMLAPTDRGLTFAGTLVVSFLIEPVDDDPYTNPGTSSQASGLVDPEIGLLELTQTDSASSATFEFLR